MNEHPPERIAAALQALCDALREQYPGVHFSPHDPDKPLPPGARTVPALEAWMGSERYREWLAERERNESE